jgi:hypothetical protein
MMSDVVHMLLDLYGAAVAALPTSTSSTGITPISPATPASPSETLSTDTALMEARNPNSTRKLPSHVYSPSPFGVLHWCNYGVAVTTVDMLNELTQMKIALRRREEERDVQDRQVKASLKRSFGAGGIKGDAEKEHDEEVEQAWQERAKDKQYSAIQRFLF